jgi:hypothetical protein
VTCGREVGPSIVEVVLPDVRREDRVEDEEALDEGVDARGELGHGFLLGANGVYATRVRNVPDEPLPSAP